MTLTDGEKMQSGLEIQIKSRREREKERERERERQRETERERQTDIVMCTEQNKSGNVHSNLEANCFTTILLNSPRDKTCIYQKVFMFLKGYYFLVSINNKT